MNAKITLSVVLAVSCVLLVAGLSISREESGQASFKPPSTWKYSAPLISPEKRDELPSRAQKDPTVVFFKGKWHVFMTVKLKGMSAIEYCSFETWGKAHNSKRTILKLTDSKYYCAPQVFFFTPHKKWYLIYQLGVKGKRKMQIAFSTTTDIADPKSWTKPGSVFRNDSEDTRKEGGLDYWMICDSKRAYLFITSLNGKMWRMSAKLEDFPHGFGDLVLALRADIFEASHTYKLSGTDKYLTVIEAQAGSRRYYKAYLADRLDGKWTEASDGRRKPFAGLPNIRPADGVAAWTDNISHGELIRKGYDQTLLVDPKNLRFIFQGALQKEKAGKNYGAIPWRIGMLTPVKSMDQ
ncbi:MAG: hypothetical protein ISS69_01190 [Phycisphaerae bacterium]|nr:hypothetical protein [Phycisphaerae bacterium]